MGIHERGPGLAIAVERGREERACRRPGAHGVESTCHSCPRMPRCPPFTDQATLTTVPNPGIRMRAGSSISSVMALS